MKQIIVLASLLVTAYSCDISVTGGTGGGNYPVDRDWGYQSKYDGYINPVASTDNKVRADVAKSLVSAINFGNKIYSKVIKPAMPELSDNTSGHKIENGNCVAPGTRSFFTTTLKDFELQSFVNYDKFCVKDDRYPTTASTTISSVKNDTNYIKERKDGNTTYDNYTYGLTVKDLQTSLKSGSNTWDNFTLSDGYFYHNKLVRVGYDNITKENFIVALDYNDGSNLNRFDLYVDTQPTYAKSIRAYNRNYGYVTATLTGLSSEVVGSNDEITMLLRDNVSCIFKPSEIGTNNFNCKKK